MAKALIQGELILAVDFDGTITTEPDGGHELVLQDNCKEVLTRLYEDGVKLILWTCRAGRVLDEALDFLEEEGLDIFCAINDDIQEVKDKYHPDISKKIGADFYIDDKNIGKKIDWLEIEEFIYG